MANNETFLKWMIDNTKTTWWHDSADPEELELGIKRGAVGATTNPFLSHVALNHNRERWSGEIRTVLEKRLKPAEQAEELMGVVVVSAAQQLLPKYEESGGEMGYVCAQVDLTKAGDRQAMLAMAQPTPN